ncbi:MAG: haloacid dehalogenase-like hydrolase [Deltaproteobacteria bacterium]|nr:haloacid dehalogenase-like hydrolase [Deltaproteobacteria bacterium]
MVTTILPRQSRQRAMNPQARFFGAGVVATTIVGALVWSGRELYHAYQECKRGTPIPEDVYFNEKKAGELARAVEPDTILTPGDLRSVFKLNEGESEAVYQELLNHRQGRLFSHPLFIRFAHVPVQSAAACVGDKRETEPGDEKSCFVVKSTRGYGDYFPGTSWSPENLTAIKGWLRSLELYLNPALIVFADCDGTLWAQGAFDFVLKTAVETGLIPKEKVDELNARFDRGETDQAFAYMNEELFAGLTLNQLDAVFQRAKRSPDFLKVYDEMKRLVNLLWEKGITVGYVSAAPFFITAAMLQESGFTAPLWTIEGNDVFIVPPNDPSAAPVKLSNLVQSKGFGTWSEALHKIGEYRIVAREVDQIVSRKGKVTAARSILERHVMIWNGHRKAVVSSQVRVAGVFGDNFAPFSDIRHANPVEEGNDQGLVRAGPLMRNALILNIEEATESGRQKRLNLARLENQLAQTASTITFLSQKAIRDQGRLIGN